MLILGSTTLNSFHCQQNFKKTLPLPIEALNVDRFKEHQIKLSFLGYYRYRLYLG